MTLEQREDARDKAQRIVNAGGTENADYAVAVGFLSLIAQVEALTLRTERAERALMRGGFVDNGAQEWKPPLGPAPKFIEVEALTVPQPLSEPNQPVILDAHGTQRFRANALVQHLLDNNGGAHIGLNELHEIDCPDADREQFAQLIGYSVSGWGTLSYVSEERWDAVQAAIDAAPTIPAIPGTKEGA